MHRIIRISILCILLGLILAGGCMMATFGKIGTSRMLTQHFTAKDYIQDGLVAMWDGIENAGWGRHSSLTNDFVELVSGNSAVVGNFTGIGELAPYTVDDTGIRSHSADKSQLVGIGIPYLNQPNLWTYECVYTVYNRDSIPRNTGTVGPVYNLIPYEGELNNRHAAFHVRFDTFVYRIFYSGQASSPNWIVNGLNTFSVARNSSKIDPEAPSNNSQKRVFHNGNIAYMNHGSGLTKSSSTTHRQFISGGFDATLHSFRIYSRPLSKSEQMFNYKIDEMRFDLP